MSESGHEVFFTISEDGQVGMFPSAAAIESALAPSATLRTRVFMEDGGELELQVELKMPNETATGPWDARDRLRPQNITTVLMPYELTHDQDYLRRSLIRRFADLPINTAMPLADVVDAVKRSSSYGFH